MLCIIICELYVYVYNYAIYSNSTMYDFRILCVAYKHYPIRICIANYVLLAHVAIMIAVLSTLYDYWLCMFSMQCLVFCFYY